MNFDVDIIIPIHNGNEFLRRCIASVLESRNQVKHRLILVDDGSHSSTHLVLEEIIRTEVNIVLITHKRSKGFSGAVNSGLKLLDAKIAIVLNSDTEVSEGWLEKILAKFGENRHIGVVGPLSNAAGTQSIPRNSVPTSIESKKKQTPLNDKVPLGLSLQEINHALERLMPKDLMWTTLIHGFCFAIKAEVVREIGFFDQETFPRGFGEENDYCIRATNGGWGLVIALDTFVWHIKSQSFQDEERVLLKEQGMEALVNKHGSRKISKLIEISRQQGEHIEFLWRECEARLK